ncbi:haloacid dehalogenase type II [Streptomyces nanshensis]|uniref:HAD family hydrolase n=1 Tax=Streptomyces nanshensis TaxID=518642 RepID=A0A1E7L1N3_9ACTN|nr:haloacid dehalogenase type II [Streptomyces nanshensis]OEV10031.1 HAD family hydrolase [Streptomyces nanshensis]
MAGIHDIEVVVFDVLGTLIDEESGFRAEVQAMADASAAADAEDLLALWLRRRESEERRVRRGDRAYAGTEVIDAEAARQVAERAGVDDPAAVERLATAGRRLPPYGDSAAGLERIARRYPVLALSNASSTALTWLNAHAGLRWHQTLSGETVSAYKPAPEVYRLAADAAGRPPERMLMVAAHAWDLRGARASGMRTAYVRRPSGDPPAESDVFDGQFGSLDELADALTAA